MSAGDDHVDLSQELGDLEFSDDAHPDADDADPEASTTPSTPKIDIEDLKARLSDIQTVVASWIEVIEDHSYTQKLRLAIDDFVIEITALLTNLEKDDVTYDDVEKASMKHVELRARYNQLRNNVNPLLQDARAKEHEHIESDSEADAAGPSKAMRHYSGDAEASGPSKARRTMPQ